MPDAPRKENLFTRKIGPLPMWGWTSIVGGGVLLWALYRRSKQSQAQAAAQQSAYAPNTVPPIVMQNFGTPEGPETTNVRVTVPPDQDDHRTDEDNDADDKRKRKHPRPKTHPHTPGPSTHHKRHRPFPHTVAVSANQPFPPKPKPQVFPIRRGPEPRPGPALQGM